MRKFLILLGCLFFALTQLTAQNRTVTGKVTDEKGKPVLNASVLVKGSKSGTTTNTDGSFTILVPQATKTLVITSINFALKEVSIANKSEISVSLIAANQILNEVVVTALGISKEKRVVGYSTATVKGEDLIKARETNVINSLAGRVSGVRVNSASGTLGGSAIIIIRGANSLDGNNQPLFVVDGFPISNATAAGGTGVASNVDYGNRAGDINPDDVETMTILKGAAAAALYGSLAKNGAVIITTKKGKKNSKTNVSVNSSTRFDNILKLPDFQNEYAQGNYGVYDLKYSNGWGPKISGVQDLKFKDFLARDVTLSAKPNNVTNFFNTGVSFINNVAFSGGGDNSDFRLSLSNVKETGIIPETKLDRYSISLNAGRDFSTKLSSRVSVSYTKTTGTGRPAQASNNSNVITSAIFGLPRTVDIEDVKNNIYLPVPDPVSGPQRFLTTDKTGNNPYWIMQNNKNNNNVDRLIATVTLSYKPVNWLTISNNLGTDFYTENRFATVRKGTAGFLPGQFSTFDFFTKRLNNDLTATAETKVKDFSLKLLVGNNILDRLSRGNTVLATGLTIDKLYTYSNAAVKTPTYGFAQQRLVAVYGEASIGYKNYAYLDVTGRNDISSTLPVANNSYFYPSVTGSFIFSELIKPKWLNYGKVRAGYASVGSDANAYLLDFQYAPATQAFIQYLGNTTVFPFGGIATPFGGPGVLPAISLQPQKQNTFEFGTDLKFLNNRIGVGFTHYNTVTRNQIVNISVPTSTGYTANSINAGAVRNKGIEVDVNLVPVRTKSFIWNIDINFSKNKQTVEKLFGSLKEYSLITGYSSLTIKAPIDGTFGLYGTGWLRDSATGSIVIDAVSGLRKTAPNVRFGDIYPAWTGGVRNSFSYKGFTMDFLVDVRHGGVFYSGTVAALRTSGLALETLENRDKVFVDKGVTLDAGSGKYIPNTVPVTSMQDFWANYSTTGNTEGNVFDASFIKLREVRLSYSLPSRIFENKFIKGMEFGIEGRNLWIIKSFVPHIDPELNFFGSGGIGEGVEFNSIPSTRSIGLNLRLSL
jgi:TonB-linked SusC/RagA family outer membrane protein